MYFEDVKASSVYLHKAYVHDNYWVYHNILNDLLLIIDNSETRQYF